MWNASSAGMDHLKNFHENLVYENLVFDIVCLIRHNLIMRWNAYFHPRFKAEFDKLSNAVQDELLASLKPLREYGPALGRPEVDTLKGSTYANMKELRFKAGGGVWHLPLTRRDLQFCLWPGISQG